MRLLLALGLILINIQCIHNRKPELCLTEHKVPSMGTFFEFQLVHSCEFDPSGYVQNSKKLLDEIESDLSLYQPGSELSKLNREGQICSSSKHLSYLINISKEAHQKTRGAFEISILPVLKSVEAHFKKYKVSPKDSDLLLLRSLVNSEEISVKDSCIQLNKNNMELSLDGITKGYAVDKLYELMPKEIVGSLLNFSGNMKWKGRKPTESWKIGFWNPVKQQVEHLSVGESGAIATSGPENIFFDKKKKWHHLIDPRTLKSPHYYESVTVLGVSAMVCDILSTSFSVLDSEESIIVKKDYYSHYQIWFINSLGNINTI